MKHSFKIISILFLLALVLSSCGKNGVNGNGELLTDKTFHITMISTAENDPVSLAAKQGAEDEIEKLMSKYPKLKIVLNWKAPESPSYMKQSSLVINAIYDGTDMLVISCLDTNVVKEAIHMADQMDVPVITYDSDIPSSERLAYIGPDHIQIGKDLIGDIAAISGTSRIAVLAGSEKLYKRNRQIKGINEALKEHSGLELMQIVHHEESPEAALYALNKIRKEHPELSAVIMLDSWLFQDTDKIDLQLLNDIDIVTVNALPCQFPYIENETIDASVGQATFKFGSRAMKLAIEKLYLEKEIDKFNIMKTIPVSIKNLGGWSRQYRAWGQEGIDKKYLKM